MNDLAGGNAAVRYATEIAGKQQFAAHTVCLESDFHHARTQNVCCADAPER